jgi:hypothetical protein
MDEPAAGRHAGQDGRQRQDGQGEQTTHPEQRERGQPTDGGVSIEPGAREHPELNGGPRPVAAGQAVGDSVAGQPGGDDGRHP